MNKGPVLVYYTQGAIDAAISNLKEGKSDVLCEQGPLQGSARAKTASSKMTDWLKQWTTAMAGSSGLIQSFSSFVMSPVLGSTRSSRFSPPR